jgi:hypothetical protein
MPPTIQSDGFNGFIDKLVNEVAIRLQARIGAIASAGLAAVAKPAPAQRAAPAKRKSKVAGRTLDMACRAPGCKNRSKGPRFSFRCEEHLKAPKSAARATAAKPEVAKAAAVVAKPAPVKVAARPVAKRAAKAKKAVKSKTKAAKPAVKAAKAKAPVKVA